MANTYNQTYKMEITELQDQLVNLQNCLISMSSIKDDIWKYHPSNENFINPIKEYDEISSEMDELERKISKVELDILHLRSAN